MRPIVISLLVCSIVILLFSVLSERGMMAQVMEKKVLMIIAHDGYRKEEFEVPLEMFKRSGITATVASTSLDTATGYPNSSVKPDVLVKDAKADDFDAIVFIGGSGASVYWNDPNAHRIAQKAAEQGKIVAAICIAPVTLARAGLLQGKKATVWPSEAGMIKDEGALYEKAKKGVVADGKIITADGPASASGFATAILEKLKE